MESIHWNLQQMCPVIHNKQGQSDRITVHLIEPDHTDTDHMNVGLS